MWSIKVLACLGLLVSLSISAPVLAEEESEEHHQAGTPEFVTPVIDGVQLSLKERPLPPRHDQCAYCHMKRDLQSNKKSKAPTMEHASISPAHGKQEISCHSCHDINNHNYLRSSPGYEASFSNSSAVCRRCHADRYRGWLRGSHGKKIGMWNGAKVIFNCIDCHNPHSVTFKKMTAAQGPYKPKFMIIKDESHD